MTISEDLLKGQVSSKDIEQITRSLEEGFGIVYKVFFVYCNTDKEQDKQEIVKNLYATSENIYELFCLLLITILVGWVEARDVLLNKCHDAGLSNDTIKQLLNAEIALLKQPGYKTGIDNCIEQFRNIRDAKQHADEDAEVNEKLVQKVELDESSNLTPLEKMQALNRGEHRAVSAMSDAKLIMNQKICLDNNLPHALDTIERRMVEKGLIKMTTADKASAINADNYATMPIELFASDFIELADDDTPFDTILHIITHRSGCIAFWYDTARELKAAVIMLILLVVLGSKSNSKELTDYIVMHFIAKQELSKLLSDLMNNSEFMNKIKKTANKLYAPSSKSANESLEIKEDAERHDELNPKLWNDEKLKPEVKSKIEEIVDEFVTGLAEDDINIDVRDIVIIGSNCSYNYNKDSDLDIHIVTDSADMNTNKLYSAYRSLFNKKFEINFFGIPVEIFVDTENTPTVSNGIYSVMNDSWIKEPVLEDIPEIDNDEVGKELKAWEDRYNKIVNDEDLTEESHNMYAKPEGNRKAAYNNALKYAKQYNKDFIYGYTDRSGKFFALEQPIKCTGEAWDEEAKFRAWYKNCNAVCIAYKDKSFIESLKESQSQEVGSIYDRLSKEYGIDFDDFVYGENGFMETNYPNGFKDFNGDIVYSEKYWNELIDWGISTGRLDASRVRQQQNNTDLNEDVDFAKSIVADQVRGEWDAIKNYERAVNELKQAGSGFDDVIDVLNSIADEEEVHVGELETAQSLLDDNVIANIDDGREEAADGDVPVDEALNEKVKSSKLDEINEFIEDVYELRKDGLAKDGEYSIGNIVFKELRNKGYLDNLKDLKNKIIGRELSLEESLGYIDDRDAYEYKIKILQLTHQNAVVQRNGRFDIYNINASDIDGVLRKLQNADFVEYVQKINAGSFNFNKIKFNGLPEQRYHIYGKIKF